MRRKDLGFRRLALGPRRILASCGAGPAVPLALGCGIDLAWRWGYGLHFSLPLPQPFESLTMNKPLLSLVRRWSVGLALGAAALAAQASFTITLNFTPQTPTAVALTSEQQSYFSGAASFWQSVITGYKDGVNFSGVTIFASGFVDAVGGVLGSAGPDTYDNSHGTWYTRTGSMEFDTADIPGMISNGSFSAVIKHEMAHVLGFGTLWTDNGLYVDGSGEYKGALALATFKTEFNQPTATFVPVELGGGPGTANGHWNEVDNGAAGSAPGPGRFELMTGWLNTPSFVSRTTAAQFQDLGYEVNLSAVPESGSWLLLLAGLPLAGFAARRRRRAA